MEKRNNSKTTKTTRYYLEFLEKTKNLQNDKNDKVLFRILWKNEKTPKRQKRQGFI